MKITQKLLDFMLIIGMIIAVCGIVFFDPLLYYLLTCIGLSIVIASNVIGLKKKIIKDRKEMVTSSVFMIIFFVGIVFCLMSLIESTHIIIGIIILFFIGIVLIALLTMLLNLIGWPKKAAEFIRNANYNILKKINIL